MIPAGLVKFISVQMNNEITGEVLIKINNKIISRLLLPDIVYNIKKKLGYIFVENHNSESMILKRGQTIYRVCDVMHSNTRGARSNIGGA